MLSEEHAITLVQMNFVAIFPFFFFGINKIVLKYILVNIRLIS